MQSERGSLTCRQLLVGAGCASGLAYLVLSSSSGTYRPGLNLWYGSTLLSEYVAGLFSAEALADGLWGVLRAASSRGETLRRLLRLEVAHQVNVLRAGGPEAIRRDPTLLWRQGLLHVRTANQADEAAKKLLARMSVETGPILRDLVLVGGGHSHAHVLLMLGMQPIPGVRVTLITRDMETPYSGMLPGHVAGVYTKEECHIDLAVLGRFARARVVHAEVSGIDVEQQRIHLRSCLDEGDAASRPPMRYDVVSVDVGCSPSFCGASGYDALRSGKLGTHVTTVKPIDGFSAKFERLVAGVSTWQGAMDVLIVGAGGGGVELALSIQYRLQATLRDLGKPQAWAQVRLVSRSHRVMPNHSRPVSNLMATVLEERGIEVLAGHEAVRTEAVQPDGPEVLVCRKQSTDPSVPPSEVHLNFNECIWCTDGAPQCWMKELGLEMDAAGFLVVETTLQARRPNGQVLENFFAAGDCATIRGHPRPKAGVFAVMAGMALSKNVIATMEGRLLDKYIPQEQFLGIIGLGGGSAVASKGDVALRSAWLWELKDWIDRTWMYKYTKGLPTMRDPDVGSNAVAKVAGADALELLKKASMRCGGCGNKVGSTVLSSAMRRLIAGDMIFENPEVIVGLSAPDDAAVVRQKGSTLSTIQTVDYFKSLVGDPYVFGRLAALHSLSDCFAMGARAQTALALATVQLGTDEAMTEDLFQMMSGANRELAAAHCTLAGGHTTEGPEPGLGFSVTGVVDDDTQLMMKGAMKPGQVLLLTKPVGTGCLFAAEMRRLARGKDISNALRSMLRSNEPASKLAFASGATCCTDVTGFGLAGHLVEMCKAAGCAAELRLEDVPVLDGSMELISRGIASSLQPANFRLRRSVHNEEAVASAFAAGRLPKYPLLFDPQTNGGLLFSVPGEAAAACQEAFAKANQPCWAVGSVTARPASWEEGRFLTITW